MQSILFWLVVAVGALYLLYNVFQRRPQGFGKMGVRLGAALKVMQSLWKGMLRLLLGYTRAITALIPRVNVPSLHSSPGPGFFRRRGPRSVRQKVLDYYLNIVYRARRHGFARRSSQTPREFTVGLGSRLPDAQDDIHSLTEAFIHAKYSRHQVDESEVGRIRVHWMRVRDAMRTMRR